MSDDNSAAVVRSAVARTEAAYQRTCEAIDRHTWEAWRAHGLEWKHKTRPTIDRLQAEMEAAYNRFCQAKQAEVRGLPLPPELADLAAPREEDSRQLPLF